MTMPGIEAVSSSFLAPVGETERSALTLQADFGALLDMGLQRLDQSIKTADTAVADFALGRDIPPHQVMLALEEARMSLQFALQVRSRLVEGYQELMRMQL